MSTIYDLITLALFAGLAILFLRRSVDTRLANDRIYHYIPPAAGLALANWLGNQHQDALAILSILVVVAYVSVVLKPFQQAP
jgi:hypothetical protein